LNVYWLTIQKNSITLNNFIKKKDFIQFFLYVLVLVLTLSCGRSSNDRTPQVKEMKDLKEPLINVNKNLTITEDQRIDDFISRYNWKMNSTGTGLRYTIYRHGSGPPAQRGQLARFNYSVVLLNGDTVYTSKESGPKGFVIGQGSVEEGLEEGILLLKKGDRAKLIIPSHLAYGLVGDMRKIPAKATLVYDIELIDLIKN
jgi:FKBP-type peptidyl-prolyl cis-trans isomerase FkpA